MRFILLTLALALATSALVDDVPSYASEPSIKVTPAVSESLEELPEFTSHGLRIVDRRANSPNNTLEARAACQNSPGVANGECVGVFQDSQERDFSKATTKYKPTCAGNCYVYDSFKQVKAAGDATYGTNCVVYWDSQCKDRAAETGNVVRFEGVCVTAWNAKFKSMQCYYRC